MGEKRQLERLGVGGVGENMVTTAPMLQSLILSHRQNRDFIRAILII